MILPIFPLPVYLLPNGITQLRIFEQRYLNMVKNSQNTQGFVIVHTLRDGQKSKYKTNAKTRLSEWGSWVDIVDFDSGEDGMLLITVRCKSLVNIADVHQQEDKLNLATILPKPHWQAEVENERCLLLKTQLERLFDSHIALQKLYPSPDFDSDNWVCARWLELLPIEFSDKQHFSQDNSFVEAVDFLTTIFVSETSS
ncbi:LON peptidase substrate-binding domain-containing protein [Thalassotalea euphylliae]|uniref:Lon N-terminal domain-containing protein n=1 Tax=Thalassotalea euphylliae TaxID=1655234 RepID=A0A3E0TYP9_9GAMM|nr:LON peptidase substrate-binding domain-containing protein [Thalassotalea euphylliae]REL29527.1 hypothetical protein DXX94_01640 [Thalassotalea euphylliae]